MNSLPIKMNLPKKFIRFISIAAITLSGYLISGTSPRTDIIKDRTAYIGENLESIIHLQNEKFESLRIEQSRIPSVKVGIPKSYIEKTYKEYGTRPLGVYNPSTNTIFITDYPFVNINTVLKHELGHSYADSLSESLGNGNWPLACKDKYSELGLRLVSEGIAEFIETEVTGRKSNFKDSAWPRSTENFWNRDSTLKKYLIYDGGRHLVGDVIREYGREGIIYLMDNLPTKEDLSDLPSYKSRVLEELSNRNARLLYQLRYQ